MADTSTPTSITSDFIVKEEDTPGAQGDGRQRGHWCTTVKHSRYNAEHQLPAQHSTSPVPTADSSVQAPSTDSPDCPAICHSQLPVIVP